MSLVGSNAVSVSWSSLNSSVATISSNGLVTGVKAGSCQVFAMARSADGGTSTYYCTVYVTVPDGIYKIQNQLSVRFLTTDEKISNGTDVYQYNSYTPTASDTARIRQMWRLKHIGNGKYVLRYLYKSDMVLYRDGTNAVIYNIGLSDSNIPAAAQWSIVWTSDDKYVIRNGANESVNYTLQPAGGSEKGGTSVIVGNETGNSASRWKFTKVTDAPTGVYLYDTAKDERVSSAERYLTSEESKSLTALSLTAVAYSPNTTSQSFTWSSSNTAVAKVNSSTGTVTGVAAGTAVITGKWSYNTSKTVSFTVHVTEIPDGTYFIQNRETGKYVQPDNDDAPSYTVNGGIMEQMSFDGGSYQKWIFTHTGDGYYKIMCVRSSLYITVPAGQETENGPDLVLKNYSGTDNQKWLITATDAGYRISAKCAGPDLVMAVEESNISNLLDNLNIQQKTYVNNNSYKDEWYLLSFDHYIGSVPLWNSDSDVVRYWQQVPTIYEEKIDDSDSFFFEYGMQHAKEQWENALNMTLNTETESNADMTCYGMTKEQYSEFFGKTWEDKVLGLTVSRFYSEGNYVIHDGTVHYLAKLTDVDIYILSSGRTVIDMKGTCTHELGHALGYAGHSKSVLELMYPTAINSAVELSNNEKNHLAQIYNLMK